VKRLKELEAENTRLRRAVSDLTLDKLILAKAARGNFLAPPVAALAWSMPFLNWVCPRDGPAGTRFVRSAGDTTPRRTFVVPLARPVVAFAQPRPHHFPK
jgi:hypothetical protein